MNQQSLVPTIEKALTMENLSPENLKQMLDIQERIFDKNAEIAFNEAMARVQKDLPSVLKESDNKQTNSKYAKLDLIIKTCSPTWTKEGFALSFGTDKSEYEKHIGITCIVSHSAGFSRNYRWDLPLDDAGIKGSVNKTPIHASGSTVSYGRRYLTCMIFNVATQDDDDGTAGNSIARVSTDQVIVINDLIKETSANRTKLLQWLKVDCVENIPAQAYNDVIAMLEKKKNAAA